MLDWKMDWNGRMEYGVDYGIYNFHSNTQIYCLAWPDPTQEEGSGLLT